MKDYHDYKIDEIEDYSLDDYYIDEDVEKYWEELEKETSSSGDNDLDDM